ncbi:uncharacterized protein LOC129307954 isoform X2 [Prosopis cineraria]|uniref:uncharacterized protein LOC129307954 isoform X2 n=1 Tax=Prosopis cineraria TaxID=364024 RepID=UPI00240EF821|nr:uncharacterized protein LOC129307954 isoform X2 [Prosopis cineraria]
MANPDSETEQAPLLTPLLGWSSNPNQNGIEVDEAQEGENEEEDQLDHALRRLEIFLTILGYKQTSVLSFALSWSAFMLIGVAVPLLALHFSGCSDCQIEKYQIRDFEMDVVAFQACLAAVSLICLSHNLRKYGLKRFLFVDRYGGQMACFHKDYVKQISESMRLLVLWLLPCFLLKIAREIIRLIHLRHESWWLSVATLLALTISWTYVSTISLSASILFHLVCNLQVIHFDDYGKLLERESDVLIFMEEHMRLRYHLLKISHRFRIYLLLEFLVVTTSQFVALLQITVYGGIISLTNGGDFAVSTLLQVVGIILCLHAATRISHRAQNIVSLASRWHALATCTSSDVSQMRNSISLGSLEAANRLNSIYLDYSESDLESLDCIDMPISTRLASYMSSQHKRQAFASGLKNWK